MNEAPDKAFFERVNAMITAANGQIDSAPAPRVATSTAFAAARFNAWVCFSHSATAEEMTRRREEAVRAFAEEYRKMFAESFDDYIHNFATYRAAQVKQASS